MKIIVLFEVIYKYLIIVVLIILLFLLGYTAYEFYVEQRSLNTILLHKAAGIILLFITFIHIYIRRKKLKKLSNEFFNIFLGKEIRLDNNMDRLNSSLEHKSLEEICLIFNITFEELTYIFKENDISFTSSKQIVKEISKVNSFRIFPMIVKLIEYKAK